MAETYKFRPERQAKPAGAVYLTIYLDAMTAAKLDAFLHEMNKRKYRPSVSAVIRIAMNRLIDAHFKAWAKEKTDAGT